MKRSLLLCLCVHLAAAGLPAPAQDAVNPDNVARFLAGLTVRGTELEAASRVAHALYLDDRDYLERAPARFPRPPAPLRCASGMSRCAGTARGSRWRCSGP